MYSENLKMFRYLPLVWLFILHFLFYIKVKNILVLVCLFQLLFINMSNTYCNRFPLISMKLYCLHVCLNPSPQPPKDLSLKQPHVGNIKNKIRNKHSTCVLHELTYQKK